MPRHSKETIKEVVNLWLDYLLELANLARRAAAKNYLPNPEVNLSSASSAITKNQKKRGLEGD